MGLVRRTGFLRALAALTVIATIATGMAPVAADPPPPSEAPPRAEWWNDLLEAADREDDPAAEPAPLIETESAPRIEDTPFEDPIPAALPAPGTDELTLGAKGAAREVEGTPLEVAAASDGRSGQELQVEVLDHATAERAGVNGFVFRVAGPGGDRLRTSRSLPLTLSLDYSEFAGLYGAGFASRLRVVALPECAVAEPIPADCSTPGTALPAENDRAEETLAVDIENLAELQGAGASGAVLALMAGPSSELGTFEATPFNVSSDWQVGVGSGEFNWSYDVPLPAAPAGPTPEVNLGYSSGAVDGMVTSKNSQASQTGLGWGDFADSFIERRYNSCRDEGTALDDLCWATENASISLNGRSSELVLIPNTGGRYWKLKDDARWRVERLTVADDPDMDNGDNNGEHWKVTTPDGVEYFFGLGRNPSTNAEEEGWGTESTWTVPVFGDDLDEPCYENLPFRWCSQAWRWNLDRVLDPNGNVQTFKYATERNHYRAVNGWPGFETTEYIRSGYLTEIFYGKRVENSENFAARVEFETGWRCASLDEPEDCPVPHDAPEQYPDVPLDLQCESNCTYTSPTFFSARRYKAVRVYMAVGAGSGTLLDEVLLTHEFSNPDPGTAEDAKLYLDQIQRTGREPDSGTSITLPPITFAPVSHNNRFSPGTGESPMPHWRIGTIKDEFGRQTVVTYAQPHACVIPSGNAWDTNTRDCFPQLWAPPAGTPTFRAFNKYLVTSVVESDTTGGSPSVTTSYQYGDQVGSGLPNGAWHHDHDDFVPQAEQSWTEWRGYQDVLVTKGASGTQTRTRHRLYRGMNGDLVQTPTPGFRTVNVTSLDSSAATTADENWLAGRTRDRVSLRPDGSVERGTVHTYTDFVTANATGTDPLRDAHWVGETDLVERLRTPDSGTVFKRRRTQTTYNTFLQFPEKVVEHGWTDDPGDDRCTQTSYAWTITVPDYLLDFPATTARYPNALCTADTEITRTETAYDNAAVGVGATKGNPTTNRTKISNLPAPAGTWATTTNTYDFMGRSRVVTDPNGRSTTTGYDEHSVDPGYPASIDVTNHLLHVEHTDLYIWRQQPATYRDANGKVTTYTYDALGRVKTAKQATEGPSDPASWTFGYDIAPGRDEVPVTQSRQLQDLNGPGGSARYLDTWTLYDSWLRERQTHTRSPGHTTANPRTIVSEQTYDGRGLPRFTNVPQDVAGAAGNALLPPPGGTSPTGWENHTAVQYDHMERKTSEGFFIGTTTPAERTTSTTYSHNSAVVTPPAGGTTRTVTDAYDRTIQVDEHDGTAYRSTAYTYDVADRLLTVKDPLLNTTTYSYDMAGRRTAMDDPDAGDWEYGYDAGGNQTSTTDALDVVVHTEYDALNRPTERRRDNSTTGPVLATWAYDASGEKGLLNSSTRVTPAGNWTIDITGYDARNRPTGRTWTLPSTSGLQTSYGPVTYGYDRADHPTSVAYPAIADLAAETVTTTYDEFGLDDTTNGLATYAAVSAYDNRGRPLLFAFGPTASTYSMGKAWQYNNKQELSNMQATATGGGVVQNRALGYDKVGNVTERNTTLGASTFRECFAYDQRQRLRLAYTTSAAQCNETNKGTGANPYNHTYTYSHDGNLASRVEGSTTVGYTYPAGGASSVRPHAPTDVGPDDYTWNANGAMATRTVGGQLNTFAWDAEHQLASIDDPDGDSAFVYDADGARLFRETPAGRTLYIDGHEITAPAGGGATRAVRSYSFSGSVVATRDATGVDYLATDNQGSVDISISAGSTTAGVTRTYFPYGKARSGGQPDTDRTWIGQIEDDATNLNFLDSRYYDASIGVFLSVDGLYDTTRPRTINPYSYAMNSPTTESDPSGLDPPCFHTGMHCSPSQIADQVATAHVVGGGSDYESAYANTLIEAWENETAISGLEDLPLNPQDLIDDIEKIGQEIYDQRVGVGVCGSLEFGFVAGVSGSGCLIATEETVGFTESFAGGFSVAGVSVSGGVTVTNAERLKDLAGNGVCFSGSIGPAGGAFCGSMDEDWNFTGVVTVMVAASKSEPGWAGNFSIMLGNTEVQEVDTPGWLQSMLRRSAPLECTCPVPEGYEHPFSDVELH